MNNPTEFTPAAEVRLDIDAVRYLDLPAPPERIRDRLAIAVSPHSFLPEVDDPRKDWVASVATPAFKLIREREGVQQAFCSIGTGVGLDALAAIEVLAASRVGVTDVHADVVSGAVGNIVGSLRQGDSVTIESGYGDLFSPLRGYASRYDLIYENLPNVPIEDASKLAEARLSSSHLPPRSEPIPALVRGQLLSLHYLALLQAHDFLNPGGSVLSLLGSRIPLSIYREMARLAGHRAEIHTYGWKVQADAELVIEGHVEQQRAGYGPFHFYPVDVLTETFASIDLASSGEHAFDIEASLAHARLDPLQARSALQRGEDIGHTYAVLRSRPAGA